MLFSITWILSFAFANGFILRNPIIVELKDNAHYRINELFDPEDLEMINKEEQLHFKATDKNVFDQLNILAVKKQVKKSSEKQIYGCSIFWSTTSDPVKTSSQSSSLRKHRVAIHERNFMIEDDYDYDALLKEYYLEAMQQSKSVETYGVKKTRDRKCKMNRSREDIDKQFAATGCWKFLKLWLLVYFLLTIPLWCAKGWCCCCLCCKTCKPRRTIKEAKKYIMLNPPGVLYVNGKETLYEPTEEEKESYEKFEHLLRTI